MHLMRQNSEGIRIGIYAMRKKPMQSDRISFNGTLKWDCIMELYCRTAFILY